MHSNKGTKMFKLNAAASKAEYAEHMGTEVLLGKKICKVVEYTKNGQSGSSDRGFKFSTTKYGGLHDVKTRQVSFDHGVTWNWVMGQYYHDVFKATKTGRVRLASNSHKEFSFDAIQTLNRDYHGSDYKWKA
jgi:hypothetical protein